MQTQKEQDENMNDSLLQLLGDKKPDYLDNKIVIDTNPETKTKK